MTAEGWIIVLMLGGIAGALGQVARVVVGLKKRADAAAAQGKAEAIDSTRLIMSIATGFTAGALAAIAVTEVGAAAITTEQVLGFAAAGYAGTDFIEGVMRAKVRASPGAPVAE